MTNLARTVHRLLLMLALLGACGDEQRAERSPDDKREDRADGTDSTARSYAPVEAGVAAVMLDAGREGASYPAPDTGLAFPDDRRVVPTSPATEDAGGRAPGSDAASPRADAAAGSDASARDLMDMTVSATIVVRAGETFDGAGKRFRASDALGDGSQDEGQKPVFKLEDGAKLVNVVLGAPAADGIHTHGDVTLENIVWEDIGEDALTIKESGTVELRGGSAEKGEDKIFQINAASVFRVSDFRASDAGKFIRQNGGTTFKVEVFIERCDISKMDEAIFRTDSSTSTVTMTNTRYSEIGDALFLGVRAQNITESNNTEY